MILVILKLLILFPLILFLDVYDKKNDKGIHLYGIYGFFGLPGAGKTIAMCRELNQLRKDYGDKIYITTNFFYDKQDFPFESWKQLLQAYDKPLVVAWDEVQNEFNSRDFKSFPIQLLTQLTQVRKGNGVRIYYTSQRYGFVDKNFRELSFGLSDCHTVLGRYTIVKRYNPLDYKELADTVQVDRKTHIKPTKVFSFIQTSKDRDCYDSFKMLESAKGKDYLNRDEVSALESK